MLFFKQDIAGLTYCQDFSTSYKVGLSSCVEFFFLIFVFKHPMEAINPFFHFVKAISALSEI